MAGDNEIKGIAREPLETDAEFRARAVVLGGEAAGLILDRVYADGVVPIALGGDMAVDHMLGDPSYSLKGDWASDLLRRAYGDPVPPVEGAQLEQLALDYVGLYRRHNESDQDLRLRIMQRVRGSSRQEAKKYNFGYPAGMMGADRLAREWADDFSVLNERMLKCNYHDWAKDSASSRGGKIRLRGQRLGRKQLGELSARYAHARREGVPNRHDSARWLRRFAAACDVANDALLEGDRARAAQVLLEVVSLQDAVRLTAESFRPVLSRRPRKLANYVDIEIIQAGTIVYAAADAANAIELGSAVSVDQDGRVHAVGPGPSQVVGTVERVNEDGTVGIRLT